MLVFDTSFSSEVLHVCWERRATWLEIVWVLATMGPPCPHRGVHTQTVPERQINLYVYYYYLISCTGSSLLRAGFLWLPWAGPSLQLDAQAHSLQWLLLLQTMGSRAWVLAVVAQKCADLVVTQHVGSSWTRDQTHVLCIGRQILNH